MTFALYWFAAPHVHTSLRSEWSGWTPPRGEFPESVRMGSTVFTVGLQFN